MADVAEQTPATPDPACEVAHDRSPAGGAGGRRLVVVYATTLGGHLLDWGRELGFTTTLVEPDEPALQALAPRADAATADPAALVMDPRADVVVTDHHRGDLGEVMAPLVTAGPRWIGIIGAPRHEGPHRAALRALGLDDAAIATVRRPIGLDIGSRTPAEIALSVLAGLLADRNGRAGGSLGRRPNAS